MWSKHLAGGVVTNLEEASVPSVTPLRANFLRYVV